MRKRRELSPEELGLWRKVAASIKPLPHQTGPHQSLPPAPAQTSPIPFVKEHTQPAAPAPKPLARPAPAVHDLDLATERRIRRGRMGIDGRIDLHGYTQAHAHTALMRFIASQRSRGARLVLVITGKGRPDMTSDHGHGILRRLVPNWLTGPGMAEHVVSVGEALPRHGGHGALYVYLRKIRE